LWYINLIELKGILISIVLLFLTSCTNIFTAIYGIKQPKAKSINEIQKKAEKYKIPLDQNYILDTSFLTFINKLAKTEKKLANDHLQPLQALYFNKSGQLVSYHINCYAGGFPNLNWERNGLLETFVPKSQTALDSLLNFEKQLQYIRTIEDKSVGLDNFSAADNNVVIYWSIFMGRQSKRLIRSIQDNCGLATDKKVKIIFVNNDNIFMLVD